MQSESFKFTAKIWEWQGEGAWHFVTLPKNLATDLDNLYADSKRGWGSLPVSVRLGDSEWQTSIFPDKKSESYLLPLKKSVRKAEGVGAGESVTIEIVVRA